MVTPKQSQKIIVGCLNWALNKVYKLYIEKRKNIPINDLGKMLLQGEDKKYSDKISKTTYKLKENEYIEADDNDCVALTNKAKIKLIDKISDGKEKDNKIRIVSFDIPESKRAKRNGFRGALKNMGFVQDQKSLWVCNKNLGDLVEIATDEFEVSEYVAYFVVYSSNIDKHVKNIIQKK